MGGYGSTRWDYHRKKYTVEECHSITLRSMPFAEYMQTDKPHARSYNWTCGDEPSGNIAIGFYPEHSKIVLIYNAVQGDTSESIKEHIHVSTSALNFGGVRYFIHCPRCNKRVRTIHKRPDSTRFRCRDCCDLVYRSAQQAHKWDRSQVRLVYLLDIEERINDINKRLRRCHYGSKNYRKYHQKLYDLYGKMGAVMDEYERDTQAMSKRIWAQLNA